MKKLLAIVLCTGLLTAAKSQIYVQAGVNISNITTIQPDQTQKNNPLTTFNAGILDRFNIAGPLKFETGLLLDGRGSKSKINISGEDYYTATFNPFYLEVPANLVLRFSFPRKAKLFVDAGPYIAMGIAGQSKLVGNIGGVAFNSSSDIKFTDANPNENDQPYSQLKRFDYGVNLGAGLDLRTIFFKLNYGIGLSQANSTQIDNVSNDKNIYRTASISLGVPLSTF